MAKYLIGNCGAIIIGLSVAYVAMLRSGHITSLFIRTGDFVQYFGISRLILHGHGGAMYNFYRLSHVEALVIYPVSLGHGVLPYLYPPYFALLVAPLAALPYGAAYLVWLLGNCVLLFATLFALERYADLSARASMWVRLISVASLPLIETFLLGQVSIIILALLVFCFFSLRSGHDYVAGTALALALIKPPYVLPFILILLVRKNWKSLRAFALTGLALLVLPISLLGLSIEEVYAKLLIEATKWQGHGTVTRDGVKVAAATYDPHINLSFDGFAQLLLPGSQARVVSLILTIIALGILAYSARRCGTVELPFALGTLVALLINPHVLLHDLTLLLLPVWVAFRYRKVVATQQLPAVLILLYVAATTGTIASRFLHFQVSVIAIVVFGAWLFFAIQRSSETGADSEQGVVLIPTSANPRWRPLAIRDSAL